MSTLWKKDGDMELIFDRVKWLKLIEDVSNAFYLEYGTKIELISPWGFEVLDDDKYLRRNLRRFYVYAGVLNKSKNQLKQITVDLIKIILRVIKDYDASFYSRIGVLSLGNTNEVKFLGVKDKSREVLLSVVVNNSKNILVDYAKYIVGSIEAELNGSGEVFDYLNNPISRWRFYQLFLMQNRLFEQFLPELSLHQQSLKSYVLFNAKSETWPFFDKDCILCANKQDLDAINLLIIPRLLQIKNFMIADSDLVHQKVYSFHSDQLINLEISEKIYNYTIEEILVTYKSFCSTQ